MSRQASPGSVQPRATFIIPSSRLLRLVSVALRTRATRRSRSRRVHAFRNEATSGATGPRRARGRMDRRTSSSLAGTESLVGSACSRIHRVGQVRTLLLISTFASALISNSGLILSQNFQASLRSRSSIDLSLFSRPRPPTKPLSSVRTTPPLPPNALAFLLLLLNSPSETVERSKINLDSRSTVAAARSPLWVQVSRCR